MPRWKTRQISRVLFHPSGYLDSNCINVNNATWQLATVVKVNCHEFDSVYDQSTQTLFKENIDYER